MIQEYIFSVPINAPVQQAWLQFLPAIIGGVSSLVGMGTGLARNARANKLEKQNPFPTASVDPNILKNQAIAEKMASIGLPGYSTYLQNIQRNQAGALRTAATSGRGTNVASILGQTNQAVAQLDVADAEARAAGQRLAMDANAAVAAENQRVWNWNEATQYQMLAQNIAQLRQSGQQDLFGGIGMLGQLAASGVFSGLGGGQSQVPGGTNKLPPTGLVGPLPGSRMYRDIYEIGVRAPKPAIRL